MAAIGIVAGLILADGEELDTMVTEDPVEQTTVAVATTATPAASDVGDDPDPAGEACTPDPGIEVRANGDIEGFPFSEQRDDYFNLGAGPT